MLLPKSNKSSHSGSFDVDLISNTLSSHTLWHLLLLCVVNMIVSVYIKTQFSRSQSWDRAGTHYYLQPHRRSPQLSHSVWLPAQSLAACTCGQTVNHIQTFHSSALLRGLDWPLFWPCGPFYRLRKEQQNRDGSIVHTEMKSWVSLTFD